MLRRFRFVLSSFVTVAVVASLVQGLTFLVASHASRALATGVTGTAGEFVPVQGKIFDTRNATGGSAQMASGVWRTVQIEGALNGSVPSDGVSAVLLTATTTNAAGNGTLYGSPNDPSKGSGVMTFSQSATMSNAAIIAVSGDGKISMKTNATTDLLLEIQGYYTAGNGTTAAGGYVPVGTPTTIANTVTGDQVPKGAIAPGQTLTVTAGGKAGIPMTASAVFVNITAYYSSGSGSGSVNPYPTGSNPVPGGLPFPGGSDPYSMGTQVALGTNGAFSMLVAGGEAVHFTVSVTGYFMPGISTGAFTPAVAGVYDSRTSPHTAIPANSTATISVAGVGGIPAAGSGISAVAMEVTTVTTGSGYMRMWGHGRTEPNISSINYDPSRYGTVGNLVTVGLGADGAIAIRNASSTATNIVLTLEGWYSSAALAISNGQTRTQQNVTLQAANTGGQWVTYKYRVGTLGDPASSFVNVPTGDVADASGSSPSAWPVTTNNGKFVPYTWNIRTTLGNLTGNNGVAPDSLVQVVACYGSSMGDSSPACGMPTDVEFSSTDGSGSEAEIGPGSVDELTGDFQLAATDANAMSSLGGLSVGRTLTTLNPVSQGNAAGVFGPGWTADLTGPDGGSGGAVPVDDSTQGFILLVDTNGTEMTFTQDPTNSQRFTAADADTGDTSVLTHPDSNTLILSVADGTTTTWSRSSNNWAVTSVSQPGSNSTSSYTYNSNGLVTRILAPVPNGVSCSNPDTTVGCRSLTLAYKTVNVGSSSVTRLGEIDLSVPQSAGVVNSISVASYDYDALGRLSHAWDPRISPALSTSYTYTPANRLATVTPPGLAAWSLTYDSSNRLVQVSRAGQSGSVATTTVVYGLSPSTSGGNAGPVELTASTTSTWGETTDVPVTGTAIFQPDHNPNGTTADSVSTSDWPYASIDYLDVNGATVNSAAYGAGAWQIGTTQYDATGNEIWNLTAGNRAQALNPTNDTDPYVASLSTGSTVDSVDAAALLRSDTRYDPLTRSVTETFGPTHPVVLASGNVIDARTHVHTSYDEGAPTGTLDPNTGVPVNPSSMQPYDLTTTITTTAFRVDTNANVISPATHTDTGWPDERINRLGYDPINNGDTSGWSLGQATANTVQLSQTPSGNDLVTRTRYDANGRIIEQRLPNDALGNSPRTTITKYFSATGTGSCADPKAAGLICSISPASQPGTGSAIATKNFTYDTYGNVKNETESFGSGANLVTRIRATTWDAAERRITTSLTVSPAAAGGSPIPLVTYGYDSNTGLPSTASTGSGSAASTLTTTYDNNGRPTTYSDSSGNLSRTGYDANGRITSVYDGQATTTYTYGNATERRGFLTSEDIGVGGSPSIFNATYDPDGKVATETYPDGLLQRRSYNGDGDSTKLTYSKSGSVWMSFSQAVNAFGITTSQASPQSSQQMTYDGAGRLVSVQDTYQGSCTSRAYAYDVDSNRTALSTYPAAAGGSCSTFTSPATIPTSFDAADRDTNSGYSYDALGRTTAVPATDAVANGTHAGSTGPLGLTYYSNDMIASETQASNAASYLLDPNQTRVSSYSQGGITLTNHYSDNTDSPDWVGSSAGTWIRYLTGPDGDMAATASNTGTVTLQLANLHGDIVATSSDAVSTSSISSYSEATEFGQPRSVTGSQPIYGWLGTKMRSADNLGGLISMGARLYNPATGRFTSPDAISGGNDNSYVYPLDPVDDSDTSGLDHHECDRHVCMTVRSKDGHGTDVTYIDVYLKGLGHGRDRLTGTQHLHVDQRQLGQKSWHFFATRFQPWHDDEYGRHPYGAIMFQGHHTFPNNTDLRGRIDGHSGQPGSRIHR